MGSTTKKMFHSSPPRVAFNDNTNMPNTDLRSITRSLNDDDPLLDLATQHFEKVTKSKTFFILLSNLAGKLAPLENHSKRSQKQSSLEVESPLILTQPIIRTPITSNNVSF